MANKKSRSGCRKVTFRKNAKGRKIKPKTVTLCDRSAKAKKRATAKRMLNSGDVCRRSDYGDKNKRTKHLFTRCR